MKDLNKIGEDLFNKLRGKFPKISIGDAEGNVTSTPKDSRFFDIVYDSQTNNNVSISLDDSGLVVMYSSNIVSDTNDVSKTNWYEFLKELRAFAKKRMLNFDIRDIQKSNLDKRDYKFLSKDTIAGENTMSESKLYGTSKVSYQNVDGARLVIKHTESVNQELAAGRTRSIGKIYIESADGERFMYPYKHLSGARAMARHVAEGGKPFDDFGTHITGLSEEMSKLRKFKNYMGRSAVMAESLAGYMDAVHDRIKLVKKTIESLQKPNYYKESFAAFEKPMMEDVPSDVAENWIDQLTIKQFNEELADVFPYIYKLVSEVTKAKELGADDLMAEMDCWDGYKKDGTQAGTGKNKGKRVNKCVPEEAELEQGFDRMMGQFAEGEETDVCPECKEAPCVCEGDEVTEAYINTSNDAVEVLGNLRKIGKSIERGQGEYEGNLANEYANDVWDVYSFIEARTNGFQGIDKNAKAAIDAMMDLRKEAKGMETKTGSGKNGQFGNQIVNTLYPVMEYLYTTKFDRNAKEGDDDTMDVKIDPKKGTIQKDDGDDEKEQKTPLGEFILSYFDTESGQFPKGETAVLTMIEKDYGEQFIEPAKAFIEQINAKFEEFQMRNQPQQMEAPDNGEYNRIRELAGLR
jgi:hypothetical protein